MVTWVTHVAHVLLWNQPHVVPFCTLLRDLNNPIHNYAITTWSLGPPSSPSPSVWTSTPRPSLSPSPSMWTPPKQLKDLRLPKKENTGMDMEVQTGPNHLNKYYRWPAVVFIQVVWPGLYLFLCKKFKGLLVDACFYQCDNIVASVFILVPDSCTAC